MLLICMDLGFANMEITVLKYLEGERIGRLGVVSCLALQLPVHH